MNTITQVPKLSEDAVIPADDPRVTRPRHVGIDLASTIAMDRGEVPRALMKLNAPQLLMQARDVLTARAVEYDKPGGERSIPAVVAMLNACLGRQALTEAEGWLFMECLKNVRLFSASTYHADSGIDGINYSALKAEAKSRES